MADVPFNPNSLLAAQYTEAELAIITRDPAFQAAFPLVKNPQHYENLRLIVEDILAAARDSESGS